MPIEHPTGGSCTACGANDHRKPACRNLQAVALLMTTAMEILRRRGEGGGAVAHHVKRAAELAIAEDILERRAAAEATR